MAFSGLSGSRAVVTGAGGGIGAAIVGRLLDEGRVAKAVEIPWRRAPGI